ncbi:MarR family winged helix-turn-helix transcriptional regulator [Nocardioides sp. URHA0020]|uniref:MarR family winged helix-turn-helix transcriptional regulator n=1 Tax=Nocardioides sp. URHA0020 TaxID=1380392 RepID=UPI00055EF152|nr:MarR family transcriptional regulator [Nocardioides sp. URHA0020]
MTDRPALDDAPWLDEDQLPEWRALVGLVMTLPAALDAQLKRDSGLNSFEYHVLAQLSEAPSCAVPMSELATLAQGSRSRLSHAVSRLEAAGWVERRECTAAGVRTAAHLTAAGQRKLEEAAPGHVREARRLVVDVLTPEQLSVLGEAARAIVAAADPGLACRMATEPAERS